MILQDFNITCVVYMWVIWSESNIPPLGWSVTLIGKYKVQEWLSGI